MSEVRRDPLDDPASLERTERFEQARFAFVAGSRSLADDDGGTVLGDGS